MLWIKIQVTDNYIHLIKLKKVKEIQRYQYCQLCILRDNSDVNYQNDCAQVPGKWHLPLSPN